MAKRRKILGDDFAKNLRFNRSGVYPQKGKGWRVQGEAVFPDQLEIADRRSTWAAWRKGMDLARSGAIADLERFTVVQAQVRDAFRAGEAWRLVPVLLAGFPSQASPEGRWTVAVLQRGGRTLPNPVAAGGQREEWMADPADPEAPPRRLLVVSLAGQPFNRMMLGEVLEDSAVGPHPPSSGSVEVPAPLAEDPSDGLGLLCIGVRKDLGELVFDAERCWRRVRLSDGRLQLVEQRIPVTDPLPLFRAGRHLTQTTTLSCNCPAHLGVEYLRLRGDVALGGQDLYPQRGPGALDPKLREGSPEGRTGEGVKRRFFDLSAFRIPGQECKHCHAVRWMLGAPLAEPGDTLSLAHGYWNDPRIYALVEGIDAPLLQPRFVEGLRRTILEDDAFFQLDSTLLAGCVGDVLGVVPQRIELSDQQVGAGVAPFLMARVAPAVSPLSVLPLGPLAPLRMNEQNFRERAEDAEEAQFGDWWVGRGTQRTVWPFRGPRQLDGHPALLPLQEDAAIVGVAP